MGFNSGFKGLTQGFTVSFTQKAILGSVRGARHITTCGARVMTPNNGLDCLVHSIVVAMYSPSRHGYLLVLCVYGVFFLLLCVLVCRALATG